MLLNLKVLSLIYYHHHVYTQAFLSHSHMVRGTCLSLFHYNMWCAPDEVVHEVFQEVAQNQAVAEETRSNLFQLLLYYHCGDADTDNLIKFVIPVSQAFHISYLQSKPCFAAHISQDKYTQGKLLMHVCSAGKVFSPKISWSTHEMTTETHCF